MAISQFKLAEKIVHFLSIEAEVDDFSGCFVDKQPQSPFFLEFYSHASSICIPYLYLIDRNRIPFTGPNDPHLKSQKKLQEFSDWVTKSFELPKKKVDLMDRINLELFLKAAENPQLAKDFIYFILNHELAHIKNRDVIRSFIYKKSLNKPYINLINILSLGIFKKILILTKDRAQEKKADEFACVHAKNSIDGGIYLFSLVNEYRFNSILKRVSHSLYKTFRSATHGSFTKRIENLQKANLSS